MLDQILGRPSPTIRRSQVFLVLFFCIWRLYKGDGSVPHPHPLQSPSRTVSAAGPLPSGRISGAARKRRLWAWRIWVALVGRSRWSVGWADKLNARLSECRVQGHPSIRHVIVQSGTAGEARLLTHSPAEHLTPYQLILGVLTILYACRHLGDILGVGGECPWQSSVDERGHVSSRPARHSSEAALTLFLSTRSVGRNGEHSRSTRVSLHSNNRQPPFLQHADTRLSIHGRTTAQHGSTPPSTPVSRKQ